MITPELERDFEYLLLHGALDDPRVLESLIRTYYDYTQILINLLFDCAEDQLAVVAEVFGHVARRLDKYLIGTSFKIWFTREALKVIRKNPHCTRRTTLPWLPPEPTNLDPGEAPFIQHLRMPPPGLFLPLALLGPLGYTLAEAAEFLKTSEEKTLRLLGRAAHSLFIQGEPGRNSIPLSTAPKPEHQLARSAFLRPESLNPVAQTHIQEHLRDCPRCRAYTIFAKTLNTQLKKTPGRTTLDEIELDQIIAAIRTENGERTAQTRIRLPYREALWIAIAVGLVLSLGWVFNRLNPLVEVSSAIQALETPAPATIVDNPPSLVVTTGQENDADVARVEPESSWDPQISADGGRVVFTSNRRLVNGDTNEVNDIFVYNPDNKQITRVSVNSAGQQANNASYEPGISANGRYVVFTSWANNLVPDDALSCEFYDTVSSCPDIFLHDLVTGETRLVSKTPDGKPGNNLSQSPQISSDGGTIAFWSAASDLVTGDEAECRSLDRSFNCLDIFLYSPPTEALERIPIGRRLNQIMGNFDLSLSADGRWILLTLESSDLLAQELGVSRNNEVYLYDRDSGSFEPINLAPDGTPGNDSSYSGSISDDGRWVVFSSRASNLVPDDTQGSIDVFLRDRQDGTVQRISSAFDGGEANGNSGTMGDPDLEWWFGESLRISGDGNWVLFASKATNITRRQRDFYCGFSPDCTSNLFLFDRISGQTLQINVSNIDLIPFASLSSNGLYASFMAHSINCNPSQFCADIYMFNRDSGVLAQLGGYGILTGKEIPIEASLLENKRTLYLSGYWTTSVAFSPTGSLLAAGGRDGTVSLWSLPLEERLETVEGQVIAFSPDGTLLAAGDDDGQIYLWRMPAAQLTGVFSNEQRARGLAFTPDGKNLAVGSSLRVRIWNLETGTVREEYSYPGTVILDIAISPNGDYLAAAADDHTTWITSLTEPGYTIRLGGHDDKVNTVDFSPDGRMLATAGNDNRANLWELEETPDGRLIATRKFTFLHRDWVSSVAFSPDSLFLATGSYDNTVALWDVQKGELIDLPFQQSQNQVLSLAWGPDGKSLAAGTVRGEVHLWKDLELDQ